jgi:hypothetical protein
MDKIKGELNKDLIARKVVAKYFKWEYSNRRLLKQPGHRFGGLTFAVFTEEAAEKLTKYGIQAYGQSLQVTRFARATADSEWINCGELGHLERTCLACQALTKHQKSHSHHKNNLQHRFI